MQLELKAPWWMQGKYAESRVGFLSPISLKKKSEGKVTFPPPQSPPSPNLPALILLILPLWYNAIKKEHNKNTVVVITSQTRDSSVRFSIVLMIQWILDHCSMINLLCLLSHNNSNRYCYFDHCHHFISQTNELFNRYINNPNIQITSSFYWLNTLVTD